MAAENPVYVQGNYNACTQRRCRTDRATATQPACAAAWASVDTPGVDHVSAAVIADAVTLLSNALERHRIVRQPARLGLALRRLRRSPTATCGRRRPRGTASASSAARANFPRADQRRRRRPHRLRHRRRRPQLPALHRALGRPDAELPRLDPQLLHQPAGGRRLQVLRHRLLASRSAATTSTRSS